MIRWQTLVADENGVIEYPRVRSLVSIILGIVGGVCAIWVIFIIRELNEGLVYAMIGALVLPLTGGKIADGVGAWRDRSLSAKVISGVAPGRRTSDSGILPPEARPSAGIRPAEAPPPGR